MIAFGITALGVIALGVVALAGSRAATVLHDGAAVRADAWMGTETAMSTPTEILKSCARNGLLLI